MTGSRNWQIVKVATCEACRELKGHDSWSIIGQKVQFGLIVISRLRLVISSSREAELLECPIWMKYAFPHSSRTLL